MEYLTVHISDRQVITEKNLKCLSRAVFLFSKSSNGKICTVFSVVLFCFLTDRRYGDTGSVMDVLAAVLCAGATHRKAEHVLPDTGRSIEDIHVTGH